MCVRVCVSECASAVAAVLKQEFERDQVGCVLIGLLLLLLLLLLLPVNEPNRKRTTNIRDVYCSFSLCVTVCVCVCEFICNHKMVVEAKAALNIFFYIFLYLFFLTNY